MAYYYLANYVGKGTELDPFRPPVTGDFQTIDLRSDCTTQSGQCLVTTNQAGKFGKELTLDDVHTIITDQVLSKIKPTHKNRIEVHLGSKLIDLPFVAGGAGPFTESFNEVDTGGSWGPDLTWTKVGGGGTPAVVSSQGTNSVAAGAGIRMRIGNDASDNNEARLVSNVMELGTQSFCTLACRYQSGADTAYRFTRLGNALLASFVARLDKIVTGTVTVLADQTVARAGASTAEYMFFTVSGSTLTGYINGTSVNTLTDSAIATGTRGGGGVGCLLANSTLVDNFSFGDIGTTADAYITDTETGSGADAATAASATFTDTETGTGADSDTNGVSATLSDTETGSGVDSDSPAVAILSDTEAGTGVDSDSPPSATLSDSETGSGVDAGEVVSATLSDSDTGSGLDAGEIVGLSDAEIAAFLDSETPASATITDTETGTFTEGQEVIGDETAPQGTPEPDIFTEFSESVTFGDFVGTVSQDNQGVVYNEL